MRFVATPDLLVALRAAVAEKFGQPLTDFGACELLVLQLAEALPQRGGRGRATILRFFGRVSSAGNPTKHTLDTLAAYAGFLDFDTFCRSQPAAAARATTGVPPVSLTGLTYAESLQRGYALALATRPAAPGGHASVLALALAADPAGQEYFVESFVDLVHLNGAYGEIVREYLRHATTSQALIFGYSSLFLGAFLAEDEPVWRARLTQLKNVRVPPSLHPFPRGRRAFALLVAAWQEAPTAPVPDDLLARIQQEAPTGSWEVGTTDLPAFYNYFPAGYHFLVAEALFFTGQYGALASWLEATDQQFPALASYAHTVYQQVLLAMRAVAWLHTGQSAAAQQAFSDMQHSVQPDAAWLWDYYHVHWWLAELHFAVANGKPTRVVAALRAQIATFAAAHQMPFFNRMVQTILAAGEVAQPLTAS